MSKVNFGKAQEVIKALVQGSDPTTNEPLPPDSVLNRADVLRALLTALTAMDTVSARELRRAQLPDNVGRPWTPDEEAALIATYKSGDSVADCAIRHRRTLRAIVARLEKLGLITSEQRTTGASFLSPPRKNEQ